MVSTKLDTSSRGAGVCGGGERGVPRTVEDVGGAEVEVLVELMGTAEHVEHTLCLGARERGHVEVALRAVLQGTLADEAFLCQRADE